MANIHTLGRYSPETSRTEWLPGTACHEVGARFRGHNSNDRHEWHTDCLITEFTEPRAFAFDVAPDDDARFSTRWRYTLSAEGTGTRLTESFDSPVLDDKPPEMNPDRRRVLIEMLNTTLQRIKNDVEATVIRIAGDRDTTYRASVRANATTSNAHPDLTGQPLVGGRKPGPTEITR